MLWENIFTCKNKFVERERISIIFRYRRFYKKSFPNIETIIITAGPGKFRLVRAVEESTR